jgi:hypothetical protein
LSFDSVVGIAKGGSVVNVDGYRQLWVAKFLNDESYNFCFLRIEEECSKKSNFSGRRCKIFENGASYMDSAVDEDWLRVLWDANKEKVTTGTTLCFGGTKVRRH